MREEILYHKDENDEASTGWYIAAIDDEGYTFDAIGPYDTKEQAKKAQETEPWPI